MANPTCRLLFVDDEETILFAVRDYFEPQGYDVDAVGDANSAHTLLDEHAYAVVVIDLSLGPGKEVLGLELVSRVRQRHPDTAVVLFTAYSTPSIEEDARRQGVVTLEKPMPLHAVGVVIERLQHPHGGDSPIEVTAVSGASRIECDVRARRTRIALYSHDTMGLGHMRRNLLLAQTLCSSPLNAVVLLVAGAREAAAFAMPAGVDCLTLPALAKSGDGEYGSRHMPIRLQQMIALRSGAIRASLEAFDPDVLVVDNVPRGAVRELDSTLEALRAGHRTRVVLGLRDVLDEPAVVRAEWTRAANHQTLRDYYDLICVYGDRLICDPAVEYGFPADVAALVRFAGYLDQRQRLAPTTASSSDADPLGLPPGRMVLGLVGGGQDGVQLADAFSRMQLPADTNAVLVTGPFMPPAARQAIHRRIAHSGHFRVLDFVHEPIALLARAERVVSMGGYGTTSEILSFEKHALIVPRVTPRREQFIRAERLAALGLVHTMHPDQVTPSRLSAWIAQDLGPAPKARTLLDFGGLPQMGALLAGLVDDRDRGHVPLRLAGRACDAGL